MKKSQLGFLVLTLSMGLLSACSLGAESKGSSSSKVLFNISHEESTYFTIRGDSYAYAGDEVELTVTCNYSASSVAGVYYGDNACTYNEDNSKYVFTMPNHDVDVTVKLNWTDTSSDSFLSWKEGNITTLPQADPFDAYITYVADLSLTTDAEVTLLSTDESVIKSSALTNNFKYRDKSNIINGGYIQIDQSEISNGTTHIILTFKNKNGTSGKATIVTTLTVSK